MNHPQQQKASYTCSELQAEVEYQDESGWTGGCEHLIMQWFKRVYIMCTCDQSPSMDKGRSRYDRVTKRESQKITNCKIYTPGL